MTSIEFALNPSFETRREDLVLEKVSDGRKTLCGKETELVWERTAAIDWLVLGNLAFSREKDHVV